MLLLLLFSDFPLVFVKLEEYRFHLDTFNFVFFLLYLPLPKQPSTFCYCEMLLPCYLTVKNLHCVHSDGFILSCELFVYRLVFIIIRTFEMYCIKLL